MHRVNFEVQYLLDGLRRVMGEGFLCELPYTPLMTLLSLEGKIVTQCLKKDQFNPVMENFFFVKWNVDCFFPMTE